MKRPVPFRPHSQMHSSVLHPLSPAYPPIRVQLARSLGTWFAVYSLDFFFPKARGLRHGECSPCGRRYRPPTTTPHPPLLSGIGISSGVSPFLLSTSLRILREASRVRCVRLKRNDVGGVFLAAPSALCGFPVCLQGTSGLPVVSWQCRTLLWPLLLPRSNNFGLDWLAS